VWRQAGVIGDLRAQRSLRPDSFVVVRSDRHVRERCSFVAGRRTPLPASASIALERQVAALRINPLVKDIITKGSESAAPAPTVKASARSRATADGPVWWPDGKRIGYLTLGREGNARTRVTTVKDGTTRMLDNIRLQGFNRPFAVFPDGNRIVVGNAIHYLDEIWVLEPKR
jgi:hypothetical protein